MVSAETERQRRDGTVFPAYVTVSPVVSPAGRLLGYSALVIDISARKALEKERELLSQELLHRMKNTFAVIQGLAGQTFKPGGQEIEAFAGRLRALAAAHDVLILTEWQGGELGALARAQLGSHLSGSAPAMRLSGPTVMLPSEVAVPMALALHELATNAAAGVARWGGCGEFGNLMATAVVDGTRG